MAAELDAHGQPNPRFNAARRADRAIHEMLGLVKGVIVDGTVSDSEAQYLAHWINANPEAVEFWPGRALADRLMQIFADGRIDEDEREDLLYFLQQMVGEDHGQHGDVNPATRLPLDEPAPPLEFRDREYVFTGRFIWGTRAACHAAVEARGGIVASNITKRTRILVLGDLGSRDWAHTSFGRKIQKAVEYREVGIPLTIVDEQHWCTHL